MEITKRPSASRSTPSQPPGPVAMTAGRLSPGAHPKTEPAANGTTRKRPSPGSQVIPFGPPSAAPSAAVVTVRSGPRRKMRSGPEWLMPAESKRSQPRAGKMAS